jgi:hypothetical protein
MQLLTSGTEELKASARIVEAEAKAGWFASSWRPLLMYILIGILVLNYIISPIILALFSKKIGIELPSDVWTCLNIGLGGLCYWKISRSSCTNFSIKTKIKQSRKWIV